MDASPEGDCVLAVHCSPLCCHLKQSNCLRFANPAEAATNFERPFTPRTSLRSPRNFGNARFRRFANFDFSTPKIFFRKIFRIFFFGFSSFSVDFRGARLFLTSKSSSSRFFALDGQIFRSVRRLEVIFGFFTVRTSTWGEIYGKLWDLFFQALEIIWFKTAVFS